MTFFVAREWSKDRGVDIVALAAIGLVLAVALMTFRDYGLGWDDYTHAEYGDLLLSLYGSGLSDTRAFSFVNLYMYGGGFDMIAALAAKVLPFSLFETRRLVGALIGVVGLIVTWRLGRRIGGPIAGLFALILLATCPLFYGHMFMNPKDAPFAVCLAIALLGFVRAFEEFPRPAPATLAILGIGVGLSIGSRVIGGIVFVFAALPVLLIVVSEWRKLGARDAFARMTRFSIALLPAMALGYVVMGLVWPWGVVEPLNPLRAVAYFSTFFEKPWREMFDGALVLVPEMPRSYVPKLCALKLPEFMLVAGVGGVAGAIVSAFWSERSAYQRAALLLLAVATTLPVALTVIERPAMYNGLRHFLFVLPPFAVLGGWGVAFALSKALEPQRMLRLACAVAVAAGVTAPIIEMVRLHPYQYTHFNMMAGGVRGADDRFMIDYWGLAFKQAAQDLRQRLTERLETPPGGSRRWRIAVCGPHSAAQVELGPEFRLTWDAKGADFALVLGEFYCAELHAPVLAEVEREGVVYARVYDIRGQTVSSILTMPPP